MNVHDPNLDRVEPVATALGPLRDELVFSRNSDSSATWRLMPRFAAGDIVTLTDEVLERLQVIANVPS